MVTLTGFADEISHDPKIQVDVLKSEGMSHLEVRGVWGKNILELRSDERAQYKDILDASGLSVSCIGSPIGKYPINESLSPQLEKMKLAAEVASEMNAPFIRVFSYYIPDKEPLDRYRDAVMDRMHQLREIATAHQVELVIENDSNMYGTTVEGGLDLMNNLSNSHFSAAFDPGNYVINGIDPMKEAFPELERFIRYVHVKDASVDPVRFVPAGEGDSQFPLFLASLKAGGFNGYLSIEPHLHEAFPNRSDPERFVIAAKHLKRLLTEAGMPWN